MLSEMLSVSSLVSLGELDSVGDALTDGVRVPEDVTEDVRLLTAVGDAVADSSSVGLCFEPDKETLEDSLTESVLD
jgi:hypothetical protein